MRYLDLLKSSNYQNEDCCKEAEEPFSIQIFEARGRKNEKGTEVDQRQNASWFPSLADVRAK
jgi:hypothetical protein